MVTRFSTSAWLTMTGACARMRHYVGLWLSCNSLFLLPTEVGTCVSS